MKFIDLKAQQNHLTESNLTLRDKINNRIKKVLDDGKVVCIACCEALDFMEDSKPSAQVEKKPTVAPTKLVEIQSNIKCSNCGNSYSTTQSHCDNCGFINPLFRKPNKKKKKKKKK